MVNTCCVFGCSNRRKPKVFGETDNRPDLTFHRFPLKREPALAAKWIKIVRGQGQILAQGQGEQDKSWRPKDHDRVCSDHFRHGDFDNHATCRLLRRGVVPTVLPEIYYPGEKEKTQEETKENTKDLMLIRRPFEASLKMASEASKHSLPLSRVKTIMKSSPEVQSISQEALHLTGKSTELFIQALAKFSYQQSDNKGSLSYRDLAEIVNSEDTLQFLHDIVPRKVKAKDYLALLQTLEDTDS